MSRVSALFPSDRVVLREVGLRDGLQLVRQFPDTASKQEWIASEYAAGVRYFEAGSFLPASRFPQFADVRDIVAAIKARSEEHTSELQSLMRISYSVFCLKKNNIASFLTD